MTVSQRIPLALQQVFLESQGGKNVETIKAPTQGVAQRIFTKSENKPRLSIRAPGLSSLKRSRKKGDTAAEAFRKANPVSNKKKYDPSTPQGFLDQELEARGYSTKKYVSLDGGYYSRPTPLQKASFGTRMNDAVKNSDVALLSRLLDAGLSANPCNDFGESLVHRVCRRGDHELLAALIEKGCCLQTVDDYGRTPLHDAFWKSNPSPTTINLIMKEDKHLIRMMDCRGFVPLDYVRKEAHPEIISFLKSKMDQYFPRRDPGAGPERPPPLTQKKPDSSPVPDPRLAISPEAAALVANGEIEPEDALEWDEDTSYDESWDSDYDSDSSYDSEEDYDDAEMAEICMRAGGPLAVARSCFGDNCQVVSRQRKLM